MIPVFKPQIDADTMKAAVDALHLGWLGMGSYVRDFEAELTTLLELDDDRAVVAVNTGTSAIHLALLDAGVGPGDEVITPSLNNIGDFQAIGMCGASPVFVDIQEDDLAINPKLIADAIGPSTKAIIALHYMGVPCAIDEIYDVAQSHGIPVIEDAAHATGTRTRSRRIGSFGDYACFSFDAIKTVTCIDGGAVALPKHRVDNLHPQRLLGMTQPNERLYSNARAYDFDVHDQGFRYHLANLHAAIGLSQLKSLPTFIANRRKYAEFYSSEIGDVSGVIAPSRDFADVSLFHYVVRITGGKRKEFRQHLRECGVDTGVHWLPGHWFTRFKSCRGADRLPVTDQVGNEIVTLPLWSTMDDRTLSTVVDAVRSFGEAGKARAALGNSDEPRARLREHKMGFAVRRIPVLGYPEVALRAVNTRAPAVEDVDAISRWRNRFVNSFLTEFEATPERTRRWLADAVQKDDSRLLFMIEEPQTGRRVGYIGLACIDWAHASAEADAVVRGLEHHPGLMTAALRSLIEWAKSDLELRTFSVRVLADNPAVSFYRKFGFHETKRVPLTSESTHDGVVWHEITDEQAGGQRELVYMALD